MFTYLWTKLAGPGIVTFLDATALITTATFSLPGIYTLRLTVTNGLVSGFDDTIVTVLNQCATFGPNPTINEQNP